MVKPGFASWASNRDDTESDTSRVGTASRQDLIFRETRSTRGLLAFEPPVGFSPWWFRFSSTRSSHTDLSEEVSTRTTFKMSVHSPGMKVPVGSF